MAEITELMKSYKETRLAPSTMSTIYSSDRAAVNSVAIITGQEWEDVVKSLIEQAHYRGNMPSYKTCITDLFRKSGFVPVRYGGRISDLLDECNNAFQFEKKYIIKTQYGYFAVVPDNETNRYSLEGLWPASRPIRDTWVDELWLYVPGTDNRTGIKRTVKNEQLPKRVSVWNSKI